MRQHLNEEQLQQALLKLATILLAGFLAGVLFFLIMLGAAGAMLVKLVP